MNLTEGELLKIQSDLQLAQEHAEPQLRELLERAIEAVKAARHIGYNHNMMVYLLKNAKRYHMHSSGCTCCGPIVEPEEDTTGDWVRHDTITEVLTWKRMGD